MASGECHPCALLQCPVLESIQTNQVGREQCVAAAAGVPCQRLMCSARGTSGATGEALLRSSQRAHPHLYPSGLFVPLPPFGLFSACPHLASSTCPHMSSCPPVPIWPLFHLPPFGFLSTCPHMSSCPPAPIQEAREARGTTGAAHSYADSGGASEVGVDRAASGAVSGAVVESARQATCACCRGLPPPP